MYSDVSTALHCPDPRRHNLLRHRRRNVERLPRQDGESQPSWSLRRRVRYADRCGAGNTTAAASDATATAATDTNDISEEAAPAKKANKFPFAA